MLAALLLAVQAPPAAPSFRDRIDAMILGSGYTTEQLNSRWANSAAAARDPDARSLFWRAYAEQWAMRADSVSRADLDRLLRSNTEWLKAVLARIGWFDISRYGPEASQAAWLIVQHSDYEPAWQQQVLDSLAPRVARGDMQRNWYAYLVDRIAVNAGRAQIYGTQGHCAGAGNLVLAETIDPKSLDDRRAAMGLEPLDGYRRRFCGN